MASRTGFHDPALAWTRNSMALWRLAADASEVVFRRSLRMTLGAMSAPEAMAMVMEKPAAFAATAEKFTLAVATGADPARIAAAAIRPVSRKVRANVRRLRR